MGLRRAGHRVLRLRHKCTRIRRPQTPTALAEATQRLLVPRSQDLTHHLSADLAIKAQQPTILQQLLLRATLLLLPPHLPAIQAPLRRPTRILTATHTEIPTRTPITTRMQCQLSPNARAAASVPTLHHLLRHNHYRRRIAAYPYRCQTRERRNK